MLSEKFHLNSPTSYRGEDVAGHSLHYMQERVILFDYLHKLGSIVERFNEVHQVVNELW